MKIGHSITFHYSGNRPEVKDIAKSSIASFHDCCKYSFSSYIIDNQSDPIDSIHDVVDTTISNMNYTYVEDQYEKGLTGAWNLSIKQAIDDGCDLIVLAGDDIIFDDTINQLIEYVINDELNDNSIYAPVVSNIVHPPHQLASAPTGRIYQVPGVKWGQHLSPAVLVFTKKFYEMHCDVNGDLFQVENKYNYGDGKWGGQEGNLQYWAEQGTRCIVVGTSWVEHRLISSQSKTGSWRTARAKDRSRNDN